MLVDNDPSFIPDYILAINVYNSTKLVSGLYPYETIPGTPFSATTTNSIIVYSTLTSFRRTLLTADALLNPTILILSYDIFKKAAILSTKLV